MYTEGYHHGNKCVLCQRGDRERDLTPPNNYKLYKQVIYVILRVTILLHNQINYIKYNLYNNVRPPQQGTRRRGGPFRAMPRGPH